jgi:hypothetical protein
MTSVSNDLDYVPYDFLGYMNDLLRNADVTDQMILIRRAIELQAFTVSLYYPRLSQLDVSRKGPTPQVDMIAVARRHAAVKLYEYYAARALTRVRSVIKKSTSLSNPVKKRLGLKFRRDQILKEYLNLETGSLSMLLGDPSPVEFAYSLEQRLNLSERVALLIEGYLTNGDELPNTGRRPVGFQVMKDALSDSEIFDKTAKTLDNAFIELEPTSVFHYLIWFRGCSDVLRPIHPYDSNFARALLQKARALNDLAGVLLYYNDVASELNKNYGFTFIIIEEVPQVDSIYNAPLGRRPRNVKLTEAIAKVVGHSWREADLEDRR